MVENLEDRRVFNVEWRNPVDSIDVDNDGTVSPLDALVVINHINAAGSGSLANVRDPNNPYLDVDGDQSASPLDVLNIVNYLNANGGGARSLAENSSQFVQETSVTITLGQTAGTRNYRVEIDGQFDSSDSSAGLEDLLAVYLMDPENPTTTLLDRGTNGTALLTLAGSKAEFIPGRARWDGSILDIDLSDLALSDTALLKFQLLNNDSDSNTRVTIRPLTNEVDVDATSSPTPFFAESAVAAGAPLTLSNLIPLASGFVQIGNVRFDATTGKYQAELRVRNDGESLGRDVAVVFPGLPAAVSLRSPSGTTSVGEPYINLKPAIHRGGLTNGSWTEPVAIEFNNPGEVPIVLKPKVLAATNHAPTLAAIAPLTVIPGGVLEVSLNAADQDGDAIAFSLVTSDGNVSLPTGSVGSSGNLTFRPTPSQLGTYQFEVIASDGALEATRSVTLNVVADPITTTRVSGKILKVNGQPLASMPIQIGAVQGLTLADGSFTLDLGTGTVVSDTIKVRGELITGPKAYPFIAEKLAFILEHEVYANVNNVIDRPIYLPELDIAGGSKVDPTKDVAVRQQIAVGETAEIFVASGTLTNQQGTPFSGTLSITEVPIALTPASLPRGLSPDLVVTIQPGEMVFARPAPLSLPNRSGWGPGLVMDLWSINPVTGEFEDVGDAQVSADGKTVDTISGGVRNSSWHFVGGPPPKPRINGPRNPELGCGACPDEKRFNSDIELHSGTVIETHQLVPYQSQGVNRGMSLVFDSLRADPRPIVHFGFEDLDTNNFFPFSSQRSKLRLVASMFVERGSFEMTVPGLPYNQATPYANVLGGDEHFWKLPEDRGSVDAALQVDLRDQPTGVYVYSVDTGIYFFTDGRAPGSSSRARGSLVVVNSINSPFGAGWGIAGLQTLVEDANRSVMLVDGNGSELLFGYDPLSGALVSPVGDFSQLVKNADGTFQRTLQDKTVYRFNASRNLVSITDRNNNVTQYTYDAQGRPTGMIDPTGLTTTFTYSGDRVSEITDPAGRVTRLSYDIAGNLLRVTDPDSSTRNWRYDASRHMVGETDQLGRQERSTYGFHGRATSAIRKDGSQVSVQSPATDGLYPPDATLDYANAPVAYSLSNEAESIFVDGNGNVTRTVLDAAGQAIRKSDAIGAMPSVVRDSNNLPIANSNARGFVTLNKFDESGNLIQWQDNLSVRQGDDPSTIGFMFGNFKRRGEKDLYSFIGKAGEPILIDFIRPKNDYSIKANVYAPSGKQLFHEVIQLPEDGTYRVEVQNVGDPGEYAVAIRSMSNAPIIEWGKQTLPTVEPGEDVVYRFTAERDQRFVFQHSATTQSDNWYVIGANGVSAERPYYLKSANQFEFLAQASGEYYLYYRVWPSETIDPQAFQFTANLIDTIPVVKSGYGTNYDGTLQPNEEREFLFSGSQGGFVTFDIKSDYSEMHLELKGPQDQILIQAGSLTSLRNYVFFQLPYSGMFKMVLRAPLTQVATYQFSILDLASATKAQFNSVIEGSLLENQSAVYRLNGTAGQRLMLKINDFVSARLISSVSSYKKDYLVNGILTLPDTGEYYLIINRGSEAGPFSFKSIDLKQIPLVDVDQDIKGTFTTLGEDKYFRFKATSNNGLFLQNLGISFITTPEVLGEGRIIFDGDYNGLYNRYFKLENEFGSSQYDEFILIAKNPADSEVFLPHAFGFRLHEQYENTTPITIGQTVSGRLEISEVDTYTFQGEKGTNLYVDLRKSPGQASTNATWILIGPDGNEVRLPNGANLGGDIGADQGPFSLPATGTYRLQLSNLQAAKPTNYQFRLFDVVNALFVSVNSPLSRQLESGSASNWFRFNAAAGQRLKFEQTSATTQIKVYAPSGRLVLDTGTNAVQHIGISETGSHLVLVSGRDPNVATPVSYDWLISLANDTPVEASGFDVLYKGTAKDGDVVATFSGNAGQQILFRQTVGYDPFRKDSVYIVGPTGEIIAKSPVAGDFTFVLPDSGQYTARIAGPNAPFEGTVSYAFILAKYSSITRMNPGTIYSVPAPASSGFSETFTFEATAGQELVIDLIWPDSFNDDFDTNQRLTLYVESPDGGYTLTRGVPFVVTKTGTQFVKVYGSSGYAIALRLHNIGTTPKLPRDTLLEGTNSLKFEDVYRRFDVAAGERILLKANGAHWRVAHTNEKIPYSEIMWSRVETVPGTFHYEGLVEFATAGTYWLVRLGSSKIPQEYSIVMTTQPVEPVFPMTDGTLSLAKYSYDSTFNQLTSQTDQQGRRTEFDVDPANGNTRSVTNIVGLPGGNDDLLTSLTYLASGQIDTVTDPIGRILDFDYDSRGRLTSRKTAKGTSLETTNIYEYDAAGNITAIVDENGNRSVYQYDSMNRITRITLPDPDGNGPLASPIEQLNYDSAGNLRKVTNALGHTTEWTYDALNRLSSVTDAGSNTTKYTYDQAGNVTRITDPLGNVTRMLYDARNRMTASIDAAGFATRFQYDEDGNLVSLTDASGNSSKYSYDARNRRVSEEDPLGGVTIYSYNSVNEVVAQVDRLGRTTRFEYDDLGRLIHEHWFDAQDVKTNTVNYTYDAASRPIRVQDGVSDYQVTYDVLNRPTREQTSVGNGVPSTILDRTFDAVGNVLSTTDTINGALGATNAYSYDALDRLTTLTQSRAVGSASSISEKRVDIGYNALGQYTSLSRFSDVVASQSVATTSFSYDTLNRLTNISHRNPADALLNSYVFAYDSASRITRIDDMDGVTNYVYDQRDQLTSANHADALNPDENYSYDATGNRTTSHRHGTGYVVGDGVAGTIDNNRQTSDGTYTYAYDAEGNLTTRTLIASGAVREFTWDHRNRLTRVTDRPSATGAPTQVVEYSYDAMNRRIASKVDKTPGDAVDGTITYFVYDGIDVFADLTDPDGSGPEPSAISMRYLHGPSVDQVLAQESTNGDVQWMLTDHLGTVQDLVNNGGAVVNHIKYDSYGNVVAESGPAVNTRYKYTGREFDSETEMQYNRARYYDAAIGRFISEDPIGFEGGDANIYRYVANSPILATDPFGMESWDAWIYNNLGLGSPNPRPTQQPGLSEKMISTLNSIGSGIKGFILWFLNLEVGIASEVCEVAKDVAGTVGGLYGSWNNFESSKPPSSRPTPTPTPKPKPTPTPKPSPSPFDPSLQEPGSEYQ